MKIVKIIAALLSFLVLAVAAIAQVDMISAEDFLALTKNNDKLVIIDANKAKTYQANHIKGAINIDHNKLYQDGEIKGLIKSPEELAAIFGENGISEKSAVVIYDDGTQKYSSRLYWILKYIGAEDVKVLHKDMEAWKKVRLPLSTAPVKLEAVAFTPTVNAAVFASIDLIKGQMEKPDFVLVDVRTPEEYSGTTDSEGHIPSAININYLDLLTETGAFKPEAELRKIAEENGLTPDKEVVFYCKTSIRATVSFIAFKNILGFEKVRVYDGAYNEWVVSNPVVQ